MPAAIDRAATWLAAFPPAQLRYDAAIMIAAIRRRYDDDALRAADAAARAVADRDDDNPLRRLFDAGYRAAASSARGWEVPAAGAPRVNPNRVLAEAAHCAEHGLRPATLAYVTGPMRDDGGYQTTHAAWALLIAHDHGCLDDAALAAALTPLLDELRAAQPAAPGPAALDVDLFGERLLMLALAGVRDAAVDGWAASLLRAQRGDGSFGALAVDEDPYRRYHATAIACWALAAWRGG
ncbi:MAG: hypothetical protein H6709_10330 [Kofleriaceae bacterium]|nr:hypothetical protein [Kofleriaceae bacterium]